VDQLVERFRETVQSHQSAGYYFIDLYTYWNHARFDGHTFVGLGTAADGYPDESKQSYLLASFAPRVLKKDAGIPAIGVAARIRRNHDEDWVFKADPKTIRTRFVVSQELFLRALAIIEADARRLDGPHRTNAEFHFIKRNCVSWVASLMKELGIVFPVDTGTPLGVATLQERWNRTFDQLARQHDAGDFPGLAYRQDPISSDWILWESRDTIPGLDPSLSYLVLR